MQYKSFRIQNFKGIKDTTVNFHSVVGANVYAFVGLNESGKTTILEAIHSFSPDKATSELLGGEEDLGVPFKDRVPRHLISEFTGYVSVTATLTLDNADTKYIASKILESIELLINIEEKPTEIVLTRHQKFENGDFIQNFFTLITDLQVKGKRQRSWREMEVKEHLAIRNVIFERAPHIAYFPTFVFNFPETVFLTDRGDVVDRFYRRVFQDVLDYDGRGHTIEKDIVGRVQRKELVVPWLKFLPAWGEHDDRDKIQHVMDRVGAAITRLVFGRWNKIFGEDARGREVAISFEIIEGETKDEKGAYKKTEQHDVRVKFQIRDGTRRFNVNDRSLGFRWFFSFMLFTQFRVARSSANAPPLLFLFDEPASNLHAAAQARLIESFPEIAQKGHVLAYSTHSHYMIEPKWLEQTFIVTNRADDPQSSMLDQISLDDESLDVQVSTYRDFVNKHPTQTSYFQPILDRLEVSPSRFDLLRPSIVLEGRSDYYILRYAIALLCRDDLSLLPGLGAGTFGALASLHVGWNLNFLFLLDGDRQGKLERNRYAVDFGVSINRLYTIDEIVQELTTIEDLLDDNSKKIIKNTMNLEHIPNKNQIRRFFQEHLASGNVLNLGDHFSGKSLILLEALKEKLHILKSQH